MIQIALRHEFIFIIYYSPKQSDISKPSGDYAMLSFRIIVKILNICFTERKGKSHCYQLFQC